MTLAKPSVRLNAALDRVAGDARPQRQPGVRLEGETADVATATHAGIELSLHEDMDAVAEEWCAFEAHADLTPFQKFGWLGAWQRNIGVLQGARPAIVFGRSHAGELLFILPLSVDRDGFLRRLTWLGADLADYNAPLLAPAFSHIVAPNEFTPLWRAVVSLINGCSRLGFDLVELRKMPETVGTQRNPFMDLAVTPNASGAHRSALAENWESYYGKRSSATRRRDRTKLNRLAAHGEVSFVEPDEPGDIERTLETLFDQKARSFARMGVRDLFSRPGHRDFYLDIALNPALRDTVHVSRLQVGDEIAATNLGLTMRGCYYYLLASYQDSELARFGPGAAHLRELLRTAIERGFHHFDFTIGDESYKRDWCDEELKLFDHAAAQRAIALPVVAAKAMLLGAKRTIKQTPFLWRHFSKARSLAASLASKLKGSSSES